MNPPAGLNPYALLLHWRRLLWQCWLRHLLLLHRRRLQRQLGHLHLCRTAAGVGRRLQAR